MQLDRRNTLLSFLSTGALGLVGAELRASPLATTVAGDRQQCLSPPLLYALESGQRIKEPYSIAIAEYGNPAAHEVAFRRFRKLTKYQRRVTHRSTDRGKLDFARLVINYCLAQPDIRFDILFKRRPMPIMNGKAKRDFLAEEYDLFLDTFPRGPGGLLIAKRDVEQGKAHFLRRRLLSEECRPQSLDDARHDDEFMQASSLIVGAVTSSLAGRTIRGTKLLILDHFKRLCRATWLTPDALTRTGKFRIHMV